MTARPTAPTSPKLPAGQALAGASCSPVAVLDSVICGDNCETLAAMPAESVDLVVTSPPYDDLRTYGGHSWDFERLADELTRVLKPGGVIVWNVADKTVDGSETGTSMRQALHFMDVCQLRLHDTMIYAKDGPPLNHSRYEQAWEYVFVLAKGAPKAWNPITRRTKRPGHSAGRFTRADGTTKGATGKQKTEDSETVIQNIWHYPTGRVGDDRGLHPAMMPEGLAKDHVTSWSNPGDVVLDPFAGSGTTLKAAKELGRRFVGIEINPEYVAICHRRLAQEVLNLFPENAQVEAPPRSTPNQEPT